MRYLTEKLLLWITGCLFRIMPLNLGLRIGKKLGRLVYRTIPARRETDSNG